MSEPSGTGEGRFFLTVPYSSDHRWRPRFNGGEGGNEFVSYVFHYSVERDDNLSNFLSGLYRKRILIYIVPGAALVHLRIVSTQVWCWGGSQPALHQPRQFGFQFPLWQEMRKEGLPIEGFSVAAGIPSTDKAAEIIEGLKNVGIRHVAFKPGSVDGIRQVVDMAKANPGYPIILQRTGGPAGGHHSYEDFHQLILQTYKAIRSQDNICLVTESGFGGADDVWPYLTGEWSVERFAVRRMLFDGFLFAGRVMVAKEAHPSPSEGSHRSGVGCR